MAMACSRSSMYSCRPASMRTPSWSWWMLRVAPWTVSAAPVSWMSRSGMTGSGRGGGLGVDDIDQVQRHVQLDFGGVEQGAPFGLQLVVAEFIVGGVAEGGLFGGDGVAAGEEAGVLGARGGECGF